MLHATLIDRSARRTHGIVISALLIATIVASGLFLFSGCEVAKTYRATAPIIATKYISENGNYMVMLSGRKTVVISQTKFKITIDHNFEPTLAFSTDGYGCILTVANYEFIFASYEQAKKYLRIEDGQIYAASETNQSNCFISTTLTK